MSTVANAKDFYPYCSGNDGTSYIQAKTTIEHATPHIYLKGYGNYRNATVLIIVYCEDNKGNEVEWYRETADIKDGEADKILSTLSKATRVEIRVADYCSESK